MPGILEGPGSFSRWGYEKIHASDILYPSNNTIHKVENRGSIEKSIKKTDLLMTQQKNSIWHSSLKPVRWVARFVAIATLPVFLAPVGIVYNTGMLLFDLPLMGLSRNPALYKKDASLRVWAIITDVSVVLLVAFSILPYIIKPRNAAHAEEAAIAKLLAPVAVAILTFPKAAACLFCYRLERAAWMKSFTLKNDWGICGKSGELLHGNPVRDIEKPDKMIEGQFGKLHYDMCIDILVQIHTLQKMLPDDHQIRKHIPNYVTIAFDVQLGMLEIEDQAVKNAVQSRLDLLKITFQQKDKLSSFLKECFNLQSTNLNIIYNVPFSVTEEYCAFFFDKNVEIDASFSASTPEEKYAVRWSALKIQYQDQLKNNLNWKEAWDVLGIKQDATEAEITAAWRKRSIVFHPDKPSGSTELFRLVMDAKEAMYILLEKEENVQPL